MRARVRGENHDHSGGRRRGDRGSALLLMPAGVLIVLVLGAFAVDMSIVQLRKREAFDLATAAANDAATAGADQVRLRGGDYQLDPSRTAAVIGRVVGASEHAADAQWSHRATADGVEVTITLPADYVFANAIPGAPNGTQVTATASAAAPNR